MTPNKPHISEEQLAALVEGGLEGAEARTAREHLISCRNCMAAYVDVVHLRDHWHRNTSASQAEAIPTRSRFGPRARLWVLAACVPLLILAGSLLLPGAEPGLEDLDPAFTQVAAALVTASRGVGMMHPGSAGGEWNDGGTVYRSAQDGPAGLSQALSDLGELPPEKVPDSWRYLRAAGELVRGNLETARILVNNESPSTSRDPNILLVAGILAYTNGDLDKSEYYLGISLDIRPENPEARFNLAMVFAETDRKDQALEIFQELAQMEGYPLLHHRAKREMSRMGN